MQAISNGKHKALVAPGTGGPYYQELRYNLLLANSPFSITI